MLPPSRDPQDAPCVPPSDVRLLPRRTYDYRSVDTTQADNNGSKRNDRR